jgi:hypothetical protein
MMCEEEVNSDERGAESYPRVKREAERDCHLRRDMPSTLSRGMMPFRRGSCSERDAGSKEPDVLLCIHAISCADLLLPGGNVLAVRSRRCFSTPSQAPPSQFQNTSSRIFLTRSALTPPSSPTSSNTFSTHTPIFSSALNNPVISSAGTLATNTLPPYFFHLLLGPQTSTMTLPPTLILKSLIIASTSPPSSNRESNSGILRIVFGTSIFSTKALAL